MTAEPDPDDLEDPYNLGRFVQAQERSYSRALAEVRNGRKESHWMWYVFPQFLGLGHSEMAQRYAIRSVAEAKAYLEHPILGPRLRDCCEAALAVEGRAAHQIFGSPDDLKLHSCATLFARSSLAGSVFHRLLNKYFAGTFDDKTLRLMGAATDGT